MTHYSAAEIQELIDAVTKIAEQNSRTDITEGFIQAIKKPLTHCINGFIFGSGGRI